MTTRGQKKKKHRKVTRIDATGAAESHAKEEKRKGKVSERYEAQVHSRTVALGGKWYRGIPRAIYDKGVETDGVRGGRLHREYEEGKKRITPSFKEGNVQGGGR